MCFLIHTRRLLTEQLLRLLKRDMEECITNLISVWTGQSLKFGIWREENLLDFLIFIRQFEFR